MPQAAGSVVAQKRAGQIYGMDAEAYLMRVLWVASCGIG